MCEFSWWYANRKNIAKTLGIYIKTVVNYYLLDTWIILKYANTSN